MAALRRLLLILLAIMTSAATSMWPSDAYATPNTGVTISEAPPIAATPEMVSPEMVSPEMVSPEASEFIENGAPSTPFILKRPAESYAEDTDVPAQEPKRLPEPEQNRPEPNTIVLRGLNKVTGHISKLEAPVGTVMRFGNLEIIGRRCWQSPPDEQPENAGLLEIWELKPGESHERIF